MGLGEVVNTDRRIASRKVGGRTGARSLLRLGRGALVAPQAWEVRSIVREWGFALVLVGPEDGTEEGNSVQSQRCARRRS